MHDLGAGRTATVNGARLIAGYGAARVALGAALALAPATVTRPWLGPAAREPLIRSTVRLVGVRDALLGVGTVAAARAPGRAAAWALAGAAADGADLLVTIAQRSRLPRSARAVAGAAAGGALTGAYAAWRASR